MSKTFLTIIFFGLSCGLFAQSPTEIHAYIDQYKTLALEQERLYGIPAPITLAQGILESGAGHSKVAVNANNHFGIKALGNWSGDIYLAMDDEETKSKFRVYASAEDSFEDHSQLIKNNSRYQSLFNYSVFDYRSWANGLQKAGYATAQNYAKALIGYIDAYQLYTINGGVKLKPGKKKVIKKTITVEELIEDDEVIDESESSEEEEQVLLISQKTVESINGVKCTILYPGETLSSIAMKHDIAKQKILEFNETTDETDFHEGDIVFLEQKKKKYHGTQDYYRVQANETLFSIAQQFGIRTASLAKMNHKDLFSELKEGEKLRLN
jgi:LysM repeat protein